METGEFAGQYAVVTGGTRGIGAAVTRALLKQGASVTATYAGNSAAAAEFTAALPEEERRRFAATAFDVSSMKACEEFFAAYDERCPQLDIMVSCAGIRQDGVVAMLPEESWKRVLDVNLGGAFNVAKCAVLRMLRRRYGRIVLLTSPMGRLGWSGQANYAASKAGLVGMARSLAKEVARRGITVNCVSPGFIDTEFIGNLTEEQKRDYAAMVPVHRFGRPGEVAGAVLYLAGRDAGYVTGSVLEISGGL